MQYIIIYNSTNKSDKIEWDHFSYKINSKKSFIGVSSEKIALINFLLI